MSDCGDADAMNYDVVDRLRLPAIDVLSVMLDLPEGEFDQYVK